MNNTAETKISFVNLLTELFNHLSPREKDVLSRRHRLTKGLVRRETLEKIGQEYQITRERVRQIERDGIKKLKEKVARSDKSGHLGRVEQAIGHFLKKYGGAMEEGHLLDQLINFFGMTKDEVLEEDMVYHKHSLSFIISQLLADKFEKMESGDHYNTAWKLKGAPWELVEDVIEQLVKILEKESKPLTKEEFLQRVRKEDFYQEIKSKLAVHLPDFEQELLDLDEAILSYLKTSKKIKENLFGHIGLSHWQTISPKRMNDKIYLVMKQSGKPLHFTEIASLINQAGFDHKKALPATVHNELILDKRYVLIGRGIYALKEWGYEPGTVSDVIITIFKQVGQPLSKEEIVNKVLEQRKVKRATINLALMDKSKFQKLADKKYTLV
ncbi:MAG: sigma factor-like helix-turn-helix DNA-binding protein [Patescibacteria group bacterium]